MKELINKARSGNSDAFVSLIELHKQSLFMVARGYFTERMDVEDAIAETVFTCWQQISKLKKPEFFKTWLIRILINKCNDIKRKQTQTVAIESIEHIPQTDDTSSMEFESLIELVSEKNRIVLVLYYGEGYKLGQIGKMLGLPVSTVTNRLKRGRRTTLQDFGGKGYTSMNDTDKNLFEYFGRLKQNVDLPASTQKRLIVTYDAVRRSAKIEEENSNMKANHKQTYRLRKTVTILVATIAICAIFVGTAFATGFAQTIFSAMKGMYKNDDPKKYEEIDSLSTIQDETVNILETTGNQFTLSQSYYDGQRLMLGYNLDSLTKAAEFGFGVGSDGFNKIRKNKENGYGAGFSIKDKLTAEEYEEFMKEYNEKRKCGCHFFMSFTLATISPWQMERI